ncbi:MAG: YheT family hydrolase, partial [Longimicrobiales bacterium]
RFRPPPLLNGPHIQTLLGKATRPHGRPELSPSRLELPDGDFVDLVESPHCWETDRPIVLVLHGLEGSAFRRYMLVTYHALIRQRLAPVGLHFRGCSGIPNRKPRAYHSGDTVDLSAVIAWLGRRYPGRSLGVVGFSLGGNVVLKYLGEREAGETGITAAAVISVPFDLSVAATELERVGTYQIYRSYFLRSLKKKVVQKRGLIKGLADVDGALGARTLRDFDQALTAPIHGFNSAEHYYAESSSGPFLEDIDVPTLVVHAIDDPFLPAHAIPQGILKRNPALRALLPARGGHVGFVSEAGDAVRFWAEEQAARYLGSLLSA